MSYRIDTGRPLAEEVSRVAGGQIAKAVAALSDRPDGIHEAIHEARKKCKKVRGLLRLVAAADAETARAEDRRIRDAARRLAPMRDATALVETIDKIGRRLGDAEPPAGLSHVRQVLLARRDARLAADSLLEDRIRDTAADLRACGDAVKRLQAPSSARRTAKLIATGYADTVDAGADFAARARKSAAAEDFHRLRRHMKYHAMHCDLLSGLWPAMMAVRGTEADAAGEDLGDEHDVEVLYEAIGSEPELSSETEAHEWLHALIDRQRDELRRSGLAAALRLFAGGGKAAGREIRSLWRGAARA